MNRLRRYDNPLNRSRTEGEHIIHFTQRLKERFNIDLTLDQYYELLKETTKHSSNHIYSINSSSGIYEVSINDVTIWVIYGNKSNDMPARLKTALIPYKMLITPDCVSHKYDHVEFTAEVNRVIEEMVKLSTEINLENKKEFFMRGISPLLTKGALHIKKNIGATKTKILHRLAIKYLTGYDNQRSAS